MGTSKQPQWPWMSILTYDLIQTTSIVLASTCILPGTAFLVAFELHMTSEVTSDLKFEFSGLNNLCSSVFLASILLYLINTDRQAAEYDPLTGSA